MNDCTKLQLEQAKTALSSTLSKCEKALQKLKEGSPQATLTSRRIDALKVALFLIDEKLCSFN